MRTLVVTVPVGVLAGTGTLWAATLLGVPTTGGSLAFICFTCFLLGMVITRVLQQHGVI